jgi:hypothetical protein
MRDRGGAQKLKDGILSTLCPHHHRYDMQFSAPAESEA